ncbi:MAG: HEPN domain-containing protein [Candidatus Paceibacterales bacterium]
MSWKKLLKDGSLQKKKVSFREVDNILAKAHESLKAAEVLIIKDLKESAFKEAYDSMLLAGRALIFSLGYRPRAVGSHVITIRFCELFLGADFKILIGKFKKMKQKRNYLIYGTGLTISHTEAQNAIRNAKQFLKLIKKKIDKVRKQKELI